MGGIKRQRKKIETPGHPYDKVRLDRELPLVGDYGLRNKRELWKASTILSTARQQARHLLSLDPEVREKRETELLSRLSRFGMLPKNSDLDSVLALDIKVVLERRLQTIVFRKGLASSPYQARQFIAHRHIAIGSGVATSPSRLITIAEEDLISYAPHSPLSASDHPSRPQAPPAFDAGKPEKKAQPKRGRSPKDTKMKKFEDDLEEEEEETAEDDLEEEIRREKPAPKKEVPKKEAPKAEVPKKEAPKAEAPKKEAPKVEAPKAEEVKPKVEKIAEQPSKPAEDFDISMIKGIGAKTAMLLKESGFNTVAKIAKASIEDLTNVPGIGPTTATAMNNEAKALLSRKEEDN